MPSDYIADDADRVKESSHETKACTPCGDAPAHTWGGFKGFVWSQRGDWEVWDDESGEM